MEKINDYLTNNEEVRFIEIIEENINEKLIEAILEKDETQAHIVLPQTHVAPQQ